jgi:cell division protein ZapA
MLDSEAQPLVAQLGRLPESRLLLMAGLMLADKTASVEDENRQLKLKLAEIEARPPLEREKIEVAVVPAGLFETLSEIAARAESVASLVEENARQ